MKTYQFFFLSENFQLLEVKCSIYLNRRIFVMIYPACTCRNIRFSDVIPDFAATSKTTVTKLFSELPFLGSVEQLRGSGSTIETGHWDQIR